VTLVERLFREVDAREKLAFVLFLRSRSCVSTYPLVVRSDAFTGVSGLCGKIARVCFVK